MNPYKVVKEFEQELSNYTGAPYVVCVDSCTNAMFLICKRLGVGKTLLPKHTYLSIPMSICSSTICVRDVPNKLKNITKAPTKNSNLFFISMPRRYTLLPIMERPLVVFHMHHWP